MPQLQASPLPTCHNLREFDDRALGLIFKRLLGNYCPAIRFNLLGIIDRHTGSVWQLEARDLDAAEPAEAEQWQRVHEILCDPATNALALDLAEMQHRFARVEQLALDIQAECLSSIANDQDSGQTGRILNLLFKAGFRAPERENKFTNSQ